MVDHMFRSGTERRHKMEELEDRVRATGMEEHPELEEEDTFGWTEFVLGMFTGVSLYMAGAFISSLFGG